MKKYAYGYLGFAAGGRLVFGGTDVCDFENDEQYAKFKEEFPDYEELLWSDEPYDMNRRGVTPSGMEYYVMDVGHRFDAPPLSAVIRDIEETWLQRQASRFYKFSQSLKKPNWVKYAHSRLAKATEKYGLAAAVHGSVVLVALQNPDLDTMIRDVTNCVGDIFVTSWFEAAMAINRGDDFGNIPSALTEVISVMEKVYSRYSAIWGFRDVCRPDFNNLGNCLAAIRA